MQWNRRKCKYIVLVAAVAFILLVGGVTVWRIRLSAEQDDAMQKWNQDFSATDYFTNSLENGNGPDFSQVQGCFVGYPKSRDFSDERKLLEADGVIPLMDEHPLFYCVTNYSDEETLDHVSFQWNAYHDAGNSRYLVVVGEMVWEQVDDYICVNTSDGEMALAPTMTVTERDGIQIMAGGGPDRDKLMVFEKDGLWYYIEVAWEDNYEDIVMLMDWFWEHPVDMARFAGGDVFTAAVDEEVEPEWFSGYLPELSLWGEIRDSSVSVRFKNGELYSYSAWYQMQDYRSLSWYIETEPDYYRQQEILGQLEEVDKEAVVAAMEAEGSVTLRYGDYCIIVSPGADTLAEDAWELIAYLKSQER